MCSSEKYFRIGRLYLCCLVFSALISLPKGVEILSRWSTREFSSSGTRRLVIILPPMLNIPLWPSSVLVLISFRKMWKGVGERRQPCMSDSDRRSVPASFAAIKVDSTGGLVCRGSLQLGLGWHLSFIKPNSMPEDFMPYSVQYVRYLSHSSHFEETLFCIAPYSEA